VIRRRSLGVAAAALGLALACRARPSTHDGEALRIVSLAPAVTETLFAIGAEKQLVGVSDYCETPAEARSRPRLGTSITPNYEAIAGLRPTLIVSEKNVAGRRRELEALAKTEFLPWLSLREIEVSIRRLGQLTGREAKARELSTELVRKLDVGEPAGGPRVLLVLGEAGEEIWFIRRNSLHGSVLHAAGARNAVAEDVLGPPNLSAERLLELDPDAIVVLVRPDAGRPKLRAIARFQRFSTLRAVRSGRVGSVEDEAAFSHGPSIVGLVDRVHGELVRIGALE
jgi:ABC-type Fe3+-hydroxamate transport system substrate-binding protein